MKLAIMQPYFFPYIGYFQLIHAVDAFVIYDDVNFINRGWINRNYILAGGDKALMTLQLSGASQNSLINQIKLGNNREKLVKTIQHVYSRAPNYELAFPLLKDIILSEQTNLAIYLAESLTKLVSYLGFEVKWYLSSELEKNNALKGQGKILDICSRLGATQYINLPGGRELYDADKFRENNIELSFVEPQVLKYPQFKKDFISHLSIIDVIMFNDFRNSQKLVKAYSIVN